MVTWWLDAGAALRLGPAHLDAPYLHLDQEPVLLAIVGAAVLGARAWSAAVRLASGPLIDVDRVTWVHKEIQIPESSCCMDGRSASPGAAARC